MVLAHTFLQIDASGINASLFVEHLLLAYAIAPFQDL